MAPIENEAQTSQPALAQLYEESAREVRLFLAGLRLPIPPQDREDVVQEVYLRLFRALRKGERYDRRRGGLKPYVLGIARHVAIDTLRRRAPLTLDVEVLSPETAAADAADSERRALIASAMSALEAEDRTILAMRHINHLKMDELAEALACSVPTARTRLRGAADRFARELRNRGVLEES